LVGSAQSKHDGPALCPSDWSSSTQQSLQKLRQISAQGITVNCTGFGLRHDDVVPGGESKLSAKHISGDTLQPVPNHRPLVDLSRYGETDSGGLWC
jgi:hypothetical protein